MNKFFLVLVKIYIDYFLCSCAEQIDSLVLRKINTCSLSPFYHFICHFKNILIAVYYIIYYGNYVNLNINTTMTDDNPQSGNRNIYKITTVWKVKINKFLTEDMAFQW